MGTLFVVATPLGNLEDITLRAIRVLKEVDLILSEDTRETDKLLRHYDIKTSQISYRDQNHERILPRIMDALNSGKNLALVSDSGTPLISDPGFKLIELLSKTDCSIVSVPGSTAAVSALAISGLPTDKFIFLGFLPRKPGQRKQILNQYGALDSTLTIYESPYRVFRLLKEIGETLGDRKMCLVKDLTKKYEQVTRGRCDDLIADWRKEDEKGEYVVLVAKKDF